MKLTFLGTGTSTGVPALRCGCDVCRSTDPHDHRLRTSALLTQGDSRLLIDCGPDLREQLLRVGSPDLSGVVITHVHYDHVGGIDDLRSYCYPDGFDVYCRADVDEALRAHVPYCFDEHPYPGAPVLHTHILKAFTPVQIGPFEVLPLPVNHYLLDIFGYRIGNLGYITDAKTIPAATLEAISGVDTLVINALRHQSHISHMNLSEALDVIDLVKPRVAYLTHISHDMGLHAHVAPTLPDNVRLAYDGLTIDIN